MHDLTKEMEKNKSSPSAISPQDELLHKVLDSALNDEIGFQRKESNSKESKESNRDLKKVKRVLSSETPSVRLGGFPWLVNCKQTEGGTNKHRKNCECCPVSRLIVR